MLFRELPISQPDEDDILGALVARAREGSTGAFAELASRVRLRIRDWAARVVLDDDDADDVAQQVLLKLHLRLREFEGRSRFTTWLYRMTLNAALNRRRLDRRRANLLLRIAPQFSSVTPDADVRAESDRIASLVRACLDELSSRERQVFEMADLKGVATGEIAARLNLEPVSVRAALSRARKRIRLKMLEQHRNLLEEYDL